MIALLSEEDNCHCWLFALLSEEGNSHCWLFALLSEEGNSHCWLFALLSEEGNSHCDKVSEGVAVQTLSAICSLLVPDLMLKPFPGYTV